MSPGLPYFGEENIHGIAAELAAVLF